MILKYYFSHEAVFRSRQKRGSLDENIVIYFLSIFEINHSKLENGPKMIRNGSKKDLKRFVEENLEFGKS